MRLMNATGVLVLALSTCHCNQPISQPGGRATATTAPIPDEKQLSPAVKAAAVAMVNPSHSATDNDLAVYVRTAKLEARTQHDQEVAAMMDKLLGLLRTSAAYANKAAWQREQVAEASQYGFEEAKEYAKNHTGIARNYEAERKRVSEEATQIAQKLREQVQ